ncbi:hypothetical protein H6G91_11565 [Nostoc muscorum FACHB-395]|jgi:hypothetical protein|nr:hypothetical protein [Nostoc sp. C057]MBD2507907.1 hypothetical protein [Desmonostoc muscorum FACHB-395]
MSNQFIKSDLLVELSTKEQELLSGGARIIVFLPRGGRREGTLTVRGLIS